MTLKLHDEIQTSSDPKQLENQIMRQMDDLLLGTTHTQKFNIISSYMANLFVEISDHNIRKALKYENIFHMGLIRITKIHINYE